MTTPKSGPFRACAFSHEMGTAELGISPETWDRWVSEGIVPPAAPGFQNHHMFHIATKCFSNTRKIKAALLVKSSNRHATTGS